MKHVDPRILPENYNTLFLSPYSRTNKDPVSKDNLIIFINEMFPNRIDRGCVDEAEYKTIVLFEAILVLRELEYLMRKWSEIAAPLAYGDSKL